jgi:4'-phosphopantetheinyl transferase
MNVYWLEQAEADVPADDGWLAISEIQHLSHLQVPKRRVDWRLGRWTAKLAVAMHLQVPLDNQSLRDVEILADSSGAPWVCLKKRTAALSISITHRTGMAACAVAPSGAGLGCDLELVEAHSDVFIADYFTAEEQAMIAQAGGGERDKLVATLWSAKESALKALRFGLRADTRWVAVSLGDGWSTSAEESPAWERQPLLSASPTKEWLNLQARYKDGQVLQGWWRTPGRFTRTVVTTHATNTPVLLTVQS